jgi:hypothetical protein
MARTPRCAREVCRLQQMRKSLRHRQPSAGEGNTGSPPRAHPLERHGVAFAPCRSGWKSKMHGRVVTPRRRIYAAS